MHTKVDVLLNLDYVKYSTIFAVFKLFYSFFIEPIKGLSYKTVVKYELINVNICWYDCHCILTPHEIQPLIISLAIKTPVLFIILSPYCC